MGRTRTWDRDEVLAAASALFHRRGFGATSLRDIEEATGLHAGSLYAVFDSKDGLFTAVLDHYGKEVVAARLARYVSSASDSRDGIRALFRSTFEDRPVPDPGCLVTNSAIESPGLSISARAMVGLSLDALRDSFRLVADRLTDDPVRADRAAEQLLALYQGLLVLIRYGADKPPLEAVVDAVDVLLDDVEGRS
jgi:TetR/AcrR family transcriptional regulator, transcriptional repressor for nem operon